jgi:hypothetical protein
MKDRTASMPEPIPPPGEDHVHSEMRSAVARGLLIYCSDYKCSHWTNISGDQWPDGVRLSDIEPQFICRVCGQRGADVRPNFNWEIRGPTREGCRCRRSWGMQPPAAHRRSTRHQHPQHNVAALTRLAQAATPLPGAVQQLCRIRARANPRNKKEISRLIRAERGPLCAFRQHLDRVQGRAWLEVEADPRPPLVYGLLTTSPNPVVEPFCGALIDMRDLAQVMENLHGQQVDDLAIAAAALIARLTDWRGSPKGRPRAPILLLGGRRSRPRSFSLHVMRPVRLGQKIEPSKPLPALRRHRQSQPA